MKEYKDKIMEILQDDVLNGSYTENIKMEDELVADLGLDSVKFMGLFSLMEEEFGVPIISNEKNYIFFSIITVNDLIEAMDTVLNC